LARVRFLFWLRRFVFGRRARLYVRILGGGFAAERSWGRRLSCFRRRQSPVAARTSRGPVRKRRRRHFVERAEFKPSFASLEPRVLLTHNDGSLENAPATYAYTAPIAADVLEIDVTAEGYGRITAKQGTSRPTASRRSRSGPAPATTRSTSRPSRSLSSS
jgi:hypothetical protein